MSMWDADIVYIPLLGSCYDYDGLLNHLAKREQLL